MNVPTAMVGQVWVIAFNATILGARHEPSPKGRSAWKTCPLGATG